jgi:hypothetical protein
VCDPFGFLTRSRRIACLCVVSCLCEGFTTSLFRVSRMVLACSFYSLKEVQGYKMLCVRESLVGEAASGPRGGLIWRRCGRYCRGMASVLLVLLLHGEAYVPLLEGVVSVFQYCSDAPHHTWSCSRHGVSFLTV